MCECLTRIPISGARDTASALMVCSLLMHYVSESKRFLPELVCFLRELVLFGFGLRTPAESSAKRRGGEPLLNGDASVFLPITFAHHSVSHSLWDFSSTSSSESKSRSTTSNATALSPSHTLHCFHAKPPLIDMLMQPPSTDEDEQSCFSSEGLRLSLLSLTLHLVDRVRHLYSAIPSFPEVFSPLLAIVRNADAAFGRQSFGHSAQAAGGSLSGRLDPFVLARLKICTDGSFSSLFPSVFLFFLLSLFSSLVSSLCLFASLVSSASLLVSFSLSLFLSFLTSLRLF